MKDWFRAMLGVGLSLGWVACGANPVPFWTPTATPAPQTLTCPIKLGVITSQSGPAATIGQEILNGYRLAVADINAHGGVQLGDRACPLALTIEDDASTLKGGQEAFARLDAAGVPIILGTVSDDVTAALVPLAGQRQVPLLAHNADGLLITDNGYDWVFRTLPSNWETVGELLAYVRTLALRPNKDARGLHVALVYEDAPFGQSYAVALMAQAKQKGFVLGVMEPYISGQANYNEVFTDVAVVAELRSNDILMLAGNLSSDGAAFLQSQQAIDFDTQLYIASGDAFTHADFLNDPATDGLVLVVPWAASLERTDALSGRTNASFVADYQAAFAGATPSYHSASAYVNIFLAKQALEAVAATGDVHSSNITIVRRDLRYQLQQGQSTAEADVSVIGSWGDTLIGPVLFDATGQNQAPLLIGQMQNQQLEIVYPLEVASAAFQLPAYPTLRAHGR